MPNRLDKYNEYVEWCKEVNDTPFPYKDNKWVQHKSRLAMNKIRNAGKSIPDQSAADDHLDYLDSRY